jgi:hypothetical protein
MSRWRKRSVGPKNVLELSVRGDTVVGKNPLDCAYSPLIWLVTPNLRLIEKVTEDMAFWLCAHAARTFVYALGSVSIASTVYL